MVGGGAATWRGSSQTWTPHPSSREGLASWARDVPIARELERGMSALSFPAGTPRTWPALHPLKYSPVTFWVNVGVRPFAPASLGLT